MTSSHTDARAGTGPATPETLRRLRHELRTPVNHMLGYTELLLEDDIDHGPVWVSHLHRIHDAAQALLVPIAGLIGALRENTDPVEPIGELRGLISAILADCAVLDAEAERRGDEDAAADLATIRSAAGSLLDLAADPVSDTIIQPDTAPDPAATAEPPPGVMGDPGVILVVDDDPQNREMLSRRLDRLGHTVEVAAGGQEALALLRDRDFDVLLLDVMMPEMDGFEVLAHLRADTALRELPVIMLSALDEVASAVRCIELGADDYLTKPIDAVLLRARIGACLERKRLRDTEVAYLRQAAQVTGPAMIAHALVDDALTGEQGTDEASLLAAIAREAEWLDAPKGMTVFAAGDAGDCMYVVLSGRLRIDEADERGQPRSIGEVRRGGTIGEPEMLTGQPRSQTVTAVRDARLARIPRDGFERLAESYPRLLTRATSDVIGRLRDALQRRPDPEQVTTFALLPIGNVPIAETSRELSSALGLHGNTLLLDRDHLPTLLGHEAADHLADDGGTEHLAAWLNEIELDYRYVIYQADPEPSAWTRRCLRQADHVLLVGSGQPNPDDGAIQAEIARNAQSAPIDLVLLHASSIPQPSGTRAWLDRWDVRMHHHLRAGDTVGLARLARRLTGNGVDLVLGGGGARGWAHVGVIRAFQEAGIPIDAIAGTSMGALIGGAALAGHDWRELEVQAGRWGSPRALFDYTLPLVSIISGKKITTMLREVFGEANIEDLWRGFFCVSSSLSHARPVVHRTGPAWHAVRASISLPGFLPPVRQHGELLIDGSYLNNLPTDLARDVFRSGTIVAVSVSQPGETATGADFGPVVSGWDVLRRRLLPWKSASELPGVAATIMRASSLSGTYHLGESARLADYTIIPPVDTFETLDFGAYREVIRAGYEDACRQIETWHDALPGL